MAGGAAHNARWPAILLGDLAITMALTMRAVFRLALRANRGAHWFRLSRCGGSHSPCRIIRRCAAGARRWFCSPLRRTESGPLHLLVDSTGLKLGGAGEWLAEKHVTSRRRSWRKLAIGIDAGSGDIVAIDLTAKDVADDAAGTDTLLTVSDPIASFTSGRSS